MAKTTTAADMLAAVEKALNGIVKTVHAKASRNDDAIAEILAAPARNTAIRRLRETAEYKQLEQDILDGNIQADTLHQALGLAQTLISMLIKA